MLFHSLLEVAENSNRTTAPFISDWNLSFRNCQHCWPQQWHCCFCLDGPLWCSKGTYNMGFWFYWKGAEEIFWTLGVSLIPMRSCFFLAAHIRPCYLTSSGILLSSFLDNSRRNCRKGRALLELRLAEQTADVRVIIKTMQTTVLGFILFLAKKRNKKILCKSNFLINTIESR